eukprot:TRINITY_DN437_c0_g1_i2.p1 TRINITY_DN437_c0_g1~~TRINITY_DN437_c0_g1_i2.p1  ORF type:complete len:435 (+),score=21.88 TRINITY_DN437_c0_g1_i2:1605-2909(+)
MRVLYVSLNCFISIKRIYNYSYPTMEQKRIPIWLDCDPGHDDAMAIILASYSPHINLLGISTVCGNQTVDKTTINALRTLELAGISGIQVVKGSNEGLCRPSRACPEIHGGTGLGGADLPDPVQKPVPENAILRMYKAITEYPEKVALLGTAQLTNLALLLKVFPEVKKNISQIVVMGGAIGLGNMRPAAEWNIEGDPEAASVVFNSGLKVVMIPIELTHTVLVTKNIFDTLKGYNAKFGDIIVQLLSFFANTYDKIFKMPDPPLHDPCTVAYVINPGIFNTEFMHVEVETGSRCCDGRTNCDIYGMTGQPKNVHVALKVDTEKFWEMMLDALGKANEKWKQLHNKDQHVLGNYLTLRRDLRWAIFWSEYMKQIATQYRKTISPPIVVPTAINVLFPVFWVVSYITFLCSSSHIVLKQNVLIASNANFVAFICV